MPVDDYGGGDGRGWKGGRLTREQVIMASSWLIVTCDRSKIIDYRGCHMLSAQLLHRENMYNAMDGIYQGEDTTITI